MRKNYIYDAAAPTSRNEFISFISAEKEAIVVDNSLLQELTKEINSTITEKKSGSFFKKAAVPMLLLSTNPVGWITSGIVLLAGTFLSASEDFKEYVIYAGVDSLDNEIIVFHHKKKVNLKYDTVNYPAFVKTINYKKANQKVKNPSNPDSEQASSSDNKYECEIYVNTREEGGRHTPFFSNYMPRFRFDNFEATGIITLPDDMEACWPGNTVRATVAFKTISQINSGDQFAVVEGTKKDERIVGTGSVIKIAE